MKRVPTDHCSIERVRREKTNPLRKNYAFSNSMHLRTHTSWKHASFEKKDVCFLDACFSEK